MGSLVTLGDVVDDREIRFAKTGAAHIAYQVIGSGDLDVLSFSTGLLPIDAMDDEPRLAHFHNRIASFGRLIRFDARGVGMSDPMVAGPTTLEGWVEDAVAVLDAVKSRRTVILAPQDSAPQGLLLAATFPKRVASLILINGTARMAQDEGYQGISTVDLDRFLATNMEPNAAERGYDILFAAGPSVCNDEAFRSWWVKAGYRGASPAAARAVMSVNCFADLRAVLPFVRVPTLVLHRHNVMLPVHHGRYLAEHIPGARYMEMDGSDFIYWIGDSDAMLDEIEEFVTGTRHGPSADRRLATILFTDIVDSTGHVARMGDRRWQGLLEKHSLMMDRQLTRFGGHLIKDMGDGWLATFDGPAAAVNCACAIRADALLSGLELRVGVHTGEVQIREGDISGLAVHIAARVQALAQTGELLVSRTVVDLVAGSGIRFIDRGEHELKGVPGRWQVFAVLD